MSRGRRSGVGFVKDDRDRSLTFFKRRSGIFKATSDLSTLTGARIAVVLESESGRFSTFGTPDTSPIVDAFLSGDAPKEFDSSEEQKAKTTNLQNELFQLEKDKAMEDKLNKENMARIKQILETSRTAKYAHGKEEDLDATELYEMLRKLTQIEQEIKDHLPTLLPTNHVENSCKLRDPSLLKPTWWSSMPSQVVTPLTYSPRAPSHASFPHQPWSSSSPPVLARSGSLLPNTGMLPSQQVQLNLQQHPLAPRAPSIMQLQALQPMEAYAYNYHIHGTGINGNNSFPFSLSHVSPSPSTQPSLQTPSSNGSSPMSSLASQFSSPLHIDSQQLPFNPQNYKHVQPPQNFANASSTMIHSNQPLYSSPLGWNVELGTTGGNGGQTSGGYNSGFGLSTPLQGDAWARMMPGSSSAGESSSGGYARCNFGDLNFPWY